MYVRIKKITGLMYVTTRKKIAGLMYVRIKKITGLTCLTLKKITGLMYVMSKKKITNGVNEEADGAAYDE